jgi:hypothetical protein
VGEIDESPSPDRASGPPVRIRPAVLAVLAIGAVVAVGALVFDPPPAWRYGLVGAVAALYFATKVKYWL